MAEHGETYPRRRFLRQSAGAGVALAGGLPGPSCSSAESAPTARRPNILFLLTDDQRWDMMGCAGNSIIHTPNLDRLAADGVRFRNNFVTTSICAVSRASFLTGLYARCHGIHGFGTSLSESQHAASYPVMLREAGYRTGFVGKYGVGRETPDGLYDDFRGFSGQGRYFHDADGEQRHLTSMMGDDAVEFLENSNDDRPFCLSVSFKAPHVQDSETPFFLGLPGLEWVDGSRWARIPFPSRRTIPDRSSPSRVRFAARSARP